MQPTAAIKISCAGLTERHKNEQIDEEEELADSDKEEDKSNSEKDDYQRMKPVFTSLRDNQLLSLQGSAATRDTTGKLNFVISIS